MVINLKKSNITLSKIIFILSLCISILPICLAINQKYDVVTQKDKYNDKEVMEIINSICNDIRNLNYYTKDPSGTLREESILDEIKKLKNIKANNLQEAKNTFEGYKKSHLIDESTYDEGTDYYYKEEKNKYVEEIEDEKNKYEEDNKYEEKNKYKDVEAEFNKGDEEYREEAINNINLYLKDINVRLKENKNIEYYLKSDDINNTITNIYGKSRNDIVDETVRNSKDYIMFLNIKDKVAQEIKITNSMNSFSNIITNDNYIGDEIIRIANPLKVGDELYTKINNIERNNYYKIISLILAVIDIVTIIFLLSKISKKSNLVFKENFIIKSYRKLFIEIRVFIGLLMIVLLLKSYENIIYRHTIYIDIWILIGTAVLAYLIISDIFMLYLENRDREIEKNIYNNSLGIKLYKLIKESFFFKSTGFIMSISIFGLIVYVALIYLTGYSMAYYFKEPYYSFKIIASILGTIIIILYLIFLGRNINVIKICTDNIVNGNYNNKINIKGSVILKEIGNNIINIEEGLNKAIDKAIKSEKMKSELITNVSHDLKTPLTSIINYIDLLDKDNISEENHKKYLGILKERSFRLKNLIEDLFEASKAASGTLELNMEKLDPIALIRQTLGEFQDKIQIADLKIIKRIPERKLLMYADGKKTFRVFQNLISNIIKYSLKGSRVYIEVFEDYEEIVIIFKNISEYQIKFNEDELLERFKRGDSARTTEGSGLGLSIVKSLVEIQGGSFNINIDGDLFKAIVRLRLFKET